MPYHSKAHKPSSRDALLTTAPPLPVDHSLSSTRSLQYTFPAPFLTFHRPESRRQIDHRTSLDHFNRPSQLRIVFGESRD